MKIIPLSKRRQPEAANDPVADAPPNFVSRYRAWRNKWERRSIYLLLLLTPFLCFIRLPHKLATITFVLLICYYQVRRLNQKGGRHAIH
ncbi:MAG TPA: hypothetical protein VMV75_03365 [Sulfuricella sp.]|nr:hypothetical protein [Sulfuricella sp.]